MKADAQDTSAMEAPFRLRPVQELMLWLSAANHEALAICGEDESRHARIAGGAVAGTTMLALIAGTYFASHALHLPVVLAVPFGALWALIIMNLDRYVLASMRRQVTPQLTLLHALPRLALSLLIAAVIVHPLLLGVYSRDIAHQVQRDQARALGVDQAQLARAFPKIPQLETEISTLENELQSTAPGDILYSDPYYRLVRQRYGRLKQLAANAPSPALQHVYATQAARAVELLLQQRADLLNHEQTTKTGREQQLAVDRSALAPLLIQEKQRANGLARADSGVSGPADQSRALGELVASDSGVRNGYITLWLLLLTVDFLPAMMRTLALLGRAHIPDEVLDDLERTRVEIARKRLEDERTDAAEESEHQLKDGQARRATEDKRRKHIYDTYVEGQAALDDEASRILFEELAKHTDRWAREDARREIDAIDAGYAGDATRATNYESPAHDWARSNGTPPDHEPRWPAAGGNRWRNWWRIGRAA